MVFVTCNPDLFQQERAECDAPPAVVHRKLAADRFFRDSSVLPAAIEPFEPVSAESGTCLVAENQIGFGYGGVLLFIPGLATRKYRRTASPMSDSNGVLTSEWKISEAFPKRESSRET